jgi:hypothetical protein
MPFPNLDPLRRSIWLSFAVPLAALFFVASGSAMTVRAPTFAELVAKAETIVHVTVDSVRAQWDTSPSGQRVIHTYVTCRVHDTIKGPATDELELRFLGGDVGTDHLVIADMPKFDVGAEYVLFVAGNKQAFCPLVHVMHGSYPVVTDSITGERRIARHDREPLQSISDVERPLGPHTAAGAHGALSLAQFRTAIVAQLNLHDTLPAR